MVPPEVSVSPAGSVPEASAQLYPLPLHPVAERLARYAVLPVAPASEEVATDNDVLDGEASTLERPGPHPYRAPNNRRTGTSLRCFWLLRR